MQIKKEIKNDSYAIKIFAEEDGKILGWAYVIIIKNDRHNEPYALLENVYVEIEGRGGGLGNKLVLSAIEEAKNCGCYKMLATSRHGREDLHKWYQKLGFRDHGVEFRVDLIDSKPNQRD